LEVNDAVQLRAADAEVAPGRTETILSAIESYFAYFDCNSAIWMPTRFAIDQQCRAIVSTSSDNPHPPALPSLLLMLGHAG
jgi:hypothetical protein